MDEWAETAAGQADALRSIAHAPSWVFVVHGTALCLDCPFRNCMKMKGKGKEGKKIGRRKKQGIAASMRPRCNHLDVLFPQTNVPRRG